MAHYAKFSCFLTLVTVIYFSRIFQLMPVSFDPPPADDEIECGRCGAYFHIELTRCPNCGVNVYEPDDLPGRENARPGRQRSIFARLDEFLRRLTNRPYPVDELFGAAINQAELFNDLLRKVGGDRAAAERLIEFERQRSPQQNRTAWIDSAIRQWEQDNRSSPTREKEN